MKSIGRRQLLGIGTVGILTTAATISPQSARAVAAQPAAQFGTTSIEDRVWWLDPLVAGPAYSPTQRREHILSVFAEIAVAGGGTLEWPGVEYVVDRPNSSTAIWATIPANTSIKGRAGARLTLDPATAASSVGMIILQFGPLAGAGSNIEVHDLEIVCNESVIAGGSIWAVGSRRPASSTHRVDNIVISGCTIRDCRVAVSATQQTALTDFGTDQHRNWRIENCTFDTCSNRMIELAQVNGAIISNNFFIAAETAIHLVSYSRNILVTGNQGSVKDGGVRVNFGVTDCDFVDNRFWYTPTSTSTTGCLQFHSEPGSTTYTTARLRFMGNHWGAAGGSYQRSLTFYLPTGAVDVTWNDLAFTNETFVGDVIFAPVNSRAAGAASDLRFSGCTFERAIVTEATSTYDLSRIAFSSCSMQTTTAHTFSADRMWFRDSDWRAGVVIDGATEQLFDGNTWPAALTDDGTATQVGSNFVMPQS